MNAPIERGAARAVLVATLALPLIFATDAFAQEAEAERVTVTGEPVIVTGSLIPTTEEVGSNPVSVLNRDLINKSGQGTTTEQLLKSLPIASANSIPVQNNATGAGGPLGAASVSLRTNEIDLDIHGFDPARPPGNLNAVRHFDTASDLRHEVINARLWAGLHYHFSGVAGVVVGRQVANFDLRHAFQPLND